MPKDFMVLQGSIDIAALKERGFFTQDLQAHKFPVDWAH